MFCLHQYIEAPDNYLTFIVLYSSLAPLSALLSSVVRPLNAPGQFLSPSALKARNFSYSFTFNIPQFGCQVVSRAASHPAPHSLWISFHSFHSLQFGAHSCAHFLFSNFVFSSLSPSPRRRFCLLHLRVAEHLEEESKTVAGHKAGLIYR